MQACRERDRIVREGVLARRGSAHVAPFPRGGRTSSTQLLEAIGTKHAKSIAHGHHPWLTQEARSSFRSPFTLIGSPSLSVVDFELPPEHTISITTLDIGTSFDHCDPAIVKMLCEVRVSTPSPPRQPARVAVKACPPAKKILLPTQHPHQLHEPTLNEVLIGPLTPASSRRT